MSNNFKHTDIGLIPVDWEIESLANIQSERPSNINPADYSEEDFEYYSIPAYQDGGLPFKEKGGNIQSNKILLKKGTVLFGKLNPRVEKVWRVGSHTNLRKIGSTEWIPIIPNEGVSTNFLYFVEWSDYVLPKAKQLVSGSTPSRQRVDPTSFYKLKIPLPPLTEQKKIAYVLSKIQQAIEKQEQIIKTTQELKKALMQKLFTEGLPASGGAEPEPQKQTEIGPIPESWEVVSLGYLFNLGIIKFQNGFPCGNWNSQGKGIPQLRPFNITEEGQLNLGEIKYIEIDKEIKKYFLSKGDVLFNNTNSEALLGKTTTFNSDSSKYVLSNHMTIIKILDDKKLSNVYLANYLHKKWYDGLYPSICRRHVNQASVSIDQLKRILIPYPKIDQQNKISEILNNLDQKESISKNKLLNFKQFFSNCLNQLMTGQIRLKDFEFEIEKTQLSLLEKGRRDVLEW